MRAYSGKTQTALLIPMLSIRWHSVATPPLKKENTSIQRAEWDPDLVWMLWRTEKSLDPARNQTQDRLVHSLVTTLTVLSQQHL